MYIANAKAVKGHVAPGFEPVQKAFIENFVSRGELGGACCVYQHGEKVVDLWGGVRDLNDGSLWEEDTMVLVYSATKGFSAMVMALAHSRGWLNYEEKIATYWPEFAQIGKAEITVRQLLDHQAGLHYFSEPVDRQMIADLNRMTAMMERQKPVWKPGSRNAYHAITLGFYEGEIIRRVDPAHRTIGTVFQEEIADALGLDLYIRLPKDIPNSRLARLEQANMLKAILGLPFKLALSVVNPRSDFFRALMVNPGAMVVLDEDTIFSRELEVPSGGGVGTARSMAKAYGVFATGGKELGLHKDTLDALAGPSMPPPRGLFDECMRGDVDYSLGFMKHSPGFSFGHAGSYGAPGAGGSLAYADPVAGVGYAYVTNKMGVKVDGDPREVALREALMAVIK